MKLHIIGYGQMVPCPNQISVTATAFAMISMNARMISAMDTIAATHAAAFSAIAVMDSMDANVRTTYYVSLPIRQLVNQPVKIMSISVTFHAPGVTIWIMQGPN